MKFLLEAKDWFTLGPVAQEKKTLDLPFDVLPKDSPKRTFARMGKLQSKLVWDNARLYNREGLIYLVVPVTVNLEMFGEDREFSKVMIFSKRSGEKMTAKVLEILAKKGSSLNDNSIDIAATAFYNREFKKKESSSGVNANIFFYNEVYMKEDGFEFANGIWKDSKTTLYLDLAKKVAVSNLQRVTTECALWGLYLDYYNSNGDLVYSVLLYSYYVGDCGGGGPVEDPTESGDPNGSGGSGPGGGTCVLTSQQADNILNLMTSSGTSEGSYEIGAQTIDSVQVTRQPLVIHTHGVRNSYGLGYSDHHQLFFDGVRYKPSTSSTWKWESLVFSKIMLVDGTPPPCVSSDVSASVSGPVKTSDELAASWSAAISVTINIQCLAGIKVGSKLYSYNNVSYSANSF